MKGSVYKQAKRLGAKLSIKELGAIFAHLGLAKPPRQGGGRRQRDLGPFVTRPNRNPFLGSPSRQEYQLRRQNR